MGSEALASRPRNRRRSTAQASGRDLQLHTAQGGEKFMIMPLPNWTGNPVRSTRGDVGIDTALISRKIIALGAIVQSDGAQQRTGSKQWILVQHRRNTSKSCQISSFHPCLFHASQKLIENYTRSRSKKLPMRRHTFRHTY